MNIYMNMKVIQYAMDLSLRLLERFEITSYPLGREGSIYIIYYYSFQPCQCHIPFS